MSASITQARILVVDDHPMARYGLARLIDRHSDLVCCGEAATVCETIDAVARTRPDLVILDLHLKGEDGLELVKTLRALQPQLRILIHSQYESPVYAERALWAGAMGYVAKGQAAEEILTAIRRVLANEFYVTRRTEALMLHRFAGKATRPAARGPESLTDRELHVLHLLGIGMSTREIALELKLSIKTIESHRENIKRKLGVQNASALIHFATNWARQQAVLPAGLNRKASLVT